VRVLLEQRHEAFRGMRERVAAVQPGVHRHGEDETVGRVGPRLVHDYGLSFLDAAIAWCDRAIAECDDDKET